MTPKANTPIQHIEPVISILELWSSLWRGAVGGILGVIALLIYRLSTDPYLLNALPQTALISAVNGMLVGAVIWGLGRLLGSHLWFGFRLVVGILFSFVSMALYMQIDGGFYGDRRQFIDNALLLGLMFGGLAGAMAKVKSPNCD